MDMLDFNETALSSLTSRIQANLKPGILKKVPGREVRDADAKNNTKYQERHSRKNTSKSLRAKKFSRPIERDQAIRKTKSSTSSPINGRPEGKKRLRDGKFKDHVDRASSVSSKPADLKQAVLALGGTEDDFGLVRDVESESEVEGPHSKVDTKLQKDLKKMVEELGISQVAEEESESDEDFENRSREDSTLVNSNENIVRFEDYSQHNLSSKQRPDLILKPNPEWHSAELHEISGKEIAKSLPGEVVRSLHDYGRSLLKREGELYSDLNKSSSSAHQFYSTIMSSGTLSDKISALTLSVQESPIHNQRNLEILVGLAKKRNRGQAIEVLVAIKDLLGPGSLLPSDRKLRTFSSQPGLYSLGSGTIEMWESSKSLSGSLTEAHLIVWTFEDWLKSTYFEILQILETWCNDEIAFSRSKAVDIVFELLRDKPEQEANLLRLLVNKLGDTEKKIASRASYNVLQLQIPHPLMKPIIIAAIEQDVLFKPGQNMHAKYYAIITLNQTVLSSKESNIVRKVLDIYFNMFILLLSKTEPPNKKAGIVIINKKGERQGGGGEPGKMALKRQTSSDRGAVPDQEIREKLMSAVLTGINRALPFTDLNDEFFANHLDTLFRITHSSNFNTSIQALMLIQQLCGSHQVASDRFYRVLYESLLDPRLLTTSKQVLYLNLLYRALRADLNVKRVKAFSKRLLQVSAMHQPAFACAVIYLLRELEIVFPTLSMFIDEAEEELEDHEERYGDVPEHNASKKPSLRLEAENGVEPIYCYDGRKRVPEHANAEKSCLWELNFFADHYHPSVALFAQKLRGHGPMPPKPSLDSHTLIQFLDRFVYKNPKNTTNKMHGSSIMQPMAGSDTSSLLIAARFKDDHVPVNSDAFYQTSSDKVDAQDAFFHKYFNVKASGKESARRKKEKEMGRKPNEESNEVSDEEEIWQALVESHPEIEGPSDDSDIDMNDFSDLMDDDEEDANKEIEITEEASNGFESAGEDDTFDFDDEDALLDSDAEVPRNLDEAFSKQADYVPVQNKADFQGIKRSGEKKNERRRRLKNLPTFASAEDYAALLQDENDKSIL